MSYRLRTLLTALVILPLVLALALGLAMLFGWSPPRPSEPFSITIEPSLCRRASEPRVFRYKLRTLLIVLALGPPVLWLGWLGAEAVQRSMEHGDISVGSAILMVILCIAAAIYLFVPPPRIE